MTRIRTLLLTALSLAVAGPAMAQDQAIRVGYLAQVHDGPLIAAERTLANGSKVEYVKFLRYADAEIALATGDIQVSSLGYASAIGAAARGGEPRFVFVSGQSRGAINLVCRDDVKVADWQDLKGKTYGVLTGGPAEIFFDDALATHGVTGKDIKKVPFPVPGPPLIQALKDKVIDCTAVYEPFAASVVADGNGYYPPIDLAENSFLGINGGIAVNREFLAKNRAFAKQVVAEVVKNADALPTERKAWVDAVSAKTGFAPKAVALGADHVKLDWKIYDRRALVLSKAVASLGLVKQAPSDAAVAAYFDYSLLADVTGKPPADLGQGQ